MTIISNISHSISYFISHALIFISLLLSLGVHVNADQYQSQELLQRPDMSQQEEKTIEEMEAEIGNLKSDYVRSSTTRFLARHYLQKNKFDKAVIFYQQSLQGDGLSDYSKQEILSEMSSLYMQMKNYDKVLLSLIMLEKLGGKLDSSLILIRAMALSHLNRKAEALQSADAAWALEKKPEVGFLRKLLYVYYQNQSYKKAADVQMLYLASMPNDLQGWRQLSAIYLKLKDYSRAADALSVAKHKQLPLSSNDYLQLGDLYAKAENPYAAASLLSEALAKGVLKTDVENLYRLFTYWLYAKEKIEAIKTLQKILSIKPDVERYLQLAQLQMDIQQWEPMRQSVINACKISLEDQYVGQANLLLGISELRLGNRTAAREAFVNATLIGGGDQAIAWLDYMEAEKATEQESENFSGACTPKWAREAKQKYKIGSRQKGINEDKSIVQNEASQDITYTIKTSTPQTLVLASYSIPVLELEQKIAPNAIRLAMSVVKNGGRISGNMHFIFPEPILPNAEIIRFQMAFPVSKQPLIGGRYKVVDDKNYKSASYIFEGPAADLLITWEKLMQAVLADNLELTGENRQIVLDQKSTKEHLHMELQIGIR